MFKSKTFKFLLLIFIIATLALFVGKMAGDAWIELMKWLSGTAAVRGAAETITKKREQIDENIHSRSDDDLATDVVHRTER